MRTVFAKHNNQRLPQFQILTKICSDKGAKVVVKEPLNQKARTHIQNIYDNYVMLKATEKTDLSEPLKVQDSLHFRFMECGSLEDELSKYYKKNDFDAFDSLIFKYIEFVDTLADNKNTAFTPCEKFVGVFGQIDIQEDIDSVSPANIDLIFSNVFYTDSRFIVSDYEWVFDFAVPKDYIIARALVNFSKNHPIEIRRYLPSFAKYEKLFYEMEQSFHRYVFGHNDEYRLNYDIQKRNIDIVNEHRKIASRSYMPKYDVLTFIPLYHPQKSFFERVLPMLSGQSTPHKLYCISSSGHIDVKDADIELIDQKEFSHSDTRNSVLKNNADFYLFMTQDAAPCDDRLIENLLSSFGDPQVMIAYARQIPHKSASPSEVFARHANYPETSSVRSIDDLPRYGIKTFFSSNSCAMYRGDYFREAGGFAKGLDASEDMEFAARALTNGYKIAYNADAKVCHSHDYTLASLYERYFHIGSFFARNGWILESLNKHTHISSTGFSQVLKELRYLLKNAPLHIPRALLQTLIKYIAYNRGLRTKR